MDESHCGNFDYIETNGEIKIYDKNEKLLKTVHLPNYVGRSFSAKNSPNCHFCTFDLNVLCKSDGKFLFVVKEYVCGTIETWIFDDEFNIL